MRKPTRLAFQTIRLLLMALALGSVGPFLAACNEPDTLGEKIDEAGEEIEDEIDDHTDDK